MQHRYLPLALAALAGAAHSQNTVLLAVGDQLANGDTVLGFEEVAINDAGDWAAAVRVSGASQDRALIHNGQVLFRTGDPLQGIAAGLTFGRARTLDLAPDGTLTWIEEDTNAFILRSRALFADSTALLLVDSSPQGADLAGASDYRRFRQAVQDDQGGLYLVADLFFDPAPGLDGDVLLHLTSLTPNAPATLVSALGSQIAGLPGPITDIEEDPKSLSASGGDVVYRALSGGEGAVVKNDGVVAATDASSPVFGSEWSSFNLFATSLNANGNVAYGGFLDNGIDFSPALAFNSSLIAMAGDAWPIDPSFEIADFPGTTGLARGNVFVSSDDSVFWYARSSNPDTGRDEALFRNFVPVIEEGETVIDGETVARLDGSAGFAPLLEVSDDGTRILVQATLSGGREVLGLVQPFANTELIPGCVGNLGTLDTNTPVAGTILIASLDNAQSSNAFGFVVISTGPAIPGSPCGIGVPGFGEVLIDLSAQAVLGVEVSFAPAIFPVTAVPLGQIPDSVALLGQELYLQGAFADQVTLNPSQAIRLTNAARLRIGL